MKETNHETKPESNVSKLYEEMEARSAAHKRESNELLRFFGGLLLFGAGMYMIFQNLVISSSWGMGSIFRIGGFNVPNGTIMIPILIGIALLFLCDRKLWGWLFIAVGIVIVIAAVILSVNIHWRTSNGWTFFIMFAMTVAGGAMMLRELFRSK
ncbi:MAG: hypothetical protein IJV58_10450 [Oscillospiraceae bacterium]|nr:hypothetical protein [Oscillospiraceae bacterium]MBR1458358.1 hypothetical protein [Oscillospiraceae bacterium]